MSLKFDFSSWWESSFHKKTPLANNLRVTEKNTWFRIHSLPDSKRYPENDDELQTVLGRNNAVVENVLGYEECVLVVARYGQYEEAHLDYHNLVLNNSMVVFDSLDDDEDLTIWSLPLVIEKDSLNTIFKNVALGKDANVMLINKETKNILAPYDGGVDIFIYNPVDYETLKNRYILWQPQNISGL